jgi:hypothetical protein
MLTWADLMAAARLIRSGGAADPPADQRTERLAAATIGLLVLVGAIAVATVLPPYPGHDTGPGNTPETRHRAVPASRQ